MAAGVLIITCDGRLVRIDDCLAAITICGGRARIVHGG